MRLPLILLAMGALAGCATLQGEPADKYLWLEDVEGAKALEWVRAQSDRTLAELTADPRYETYLADAMAIVNAKERVVTVNVHDGQVYNFWQDEEHVRGIWRRARLADYVANTAKWETVFDLDAQAATDNANWVWKGAVCQPHRGSRCMIALSNGGKDAVVWSEFDLQTRAFAPGGFTVAEGRSSLTWLDNDTLLLAAPNGAGTVSQSGYPLTVRRWRRGEDLSAAPEIFRGAPTDVGVFVRMLEGEDGGLLHLADRRISFYEAEFVNLGGDTPAALPLPRKSRIQGLHKGEIIFAIDEAWTPAGATQTFQAGALLSRTLRAPADDKDATKLIFGPTAREGIREAAVTRDAVLVSVLDNVIGRVRRYAYDGRGWLESAVSLPAGGSIELFGESPYESTSFVLVADFLRPSSVLSINSRTGAVGAVQSPPAKFDAAGLTVQQFEAVSKDGTKIPYFLVRRADATGPSPTLLYGYGGFQVPMLPAYSGVLGKLWLEKGGAYALANIRGGGEFGPRWHEAGLKTKRQVIYDDFIAVAEDLTARGATNAEKLGIMGGSNGGLLMGVMLTQRPELFNAAVVEAPLLDMLRYHELLAGASWIGEYGDPRVEEERAWLQSMSPYHNMDPAKAGAAQPFFVVSTKDDRVHPGHARKLAARMEAAGAPFYYYENIDGGHSVAANRMEAARKSALEYVYLSRRLMDKP